MENIEKQIDIAAEIAKLIKLRYAQNVQQEERIKDEIDYKKDLLKLTHKKLNESL